MATLLHSESRRLYSWWWDSHNTPKNSKWLQDNLTDMDGKVKSMIKLIEEDADSFARRAEMYYKKRPELMKLVEEFYRAYRALAERYNHATGELRHAHKTIAAAFPDQVPLELVEEAVELLGKTNGPHKDDDQTRITGLKQLQEMFGEKEEVGRTPRSNHPKDKIALNESEVEGLKKALLDMQAEKEDVLLKYQECLEKLLRIEAELKTAEKDSMRMSEKAGQAEIEVQTLKEALNQLEVEKNEGLIKQKEHLETISCLETRATEAESQAQSLKGEISRLELENEAVVHKNKQCLGKISDLENVISVAEDNVTLLKKRAVSAETEVSELKSAFSDMKMEKEASAFQYKCCLETISKLEKDLSDAKHNTERLENEVSIRTAKIRSAEEKYTFLETSNRSLRDEAHNLAKRIARKDEELSKKQEELEKLQVSLQDEHFRRAQVEETLQNLQFLHSQSQDDQKALALELKNMLLMLKETEVSKNGFEEELEKVKDENRSLSQMNESSAASIGNMQSEIFSLREIKERLEKEVLHHMNISISLQKEISCLKEEIEELSGAHQALLEEVEEAGLNPKCVVDSVKRLSDENSNEKAILLQKIVNVEEALKKKLVVESSLSGLNAELVSSRENMKALQESCQILHGEKGSLVAEKASLISQLHAITENMHNLLEKNAVLENSLSSAKVELEGLREKSRGLEEICELLKNERSHLLTERDNLLLKLENVERRLEIVEKKIMGLEEKYADLEKEKEAMHFHVEKLELSLGVEKQERTSSQIISELRMAALENHIHLLQEENQWKKKESEEEIEKALKAQFEISILQKFIKDMEEKNYSLIIECQKHVEASKLAEKLISELESESLEQQVEAELLLDEIERLRLGIYQIFKFLESGPRCADEDKIENERTFINHILESIDLMKCSVSKHEDEKQQLLVENSVLVALLEELESRGIEIESQKMHLEKEVKNMSDKLEMVENEKDEVLEINGQLKSDLKAYTALREAYARADEENTYLLKKFFELKEEKYTVDQLNDAVFLELLANGNESVVLRSFGEEKVTEIKLLLDDLSGQHEVNSSLEKETSVLMRKLELQTAENLVLKDAVRQLERQIQEIKECNLGLNRDLINGRESLNQTEEKLFDTEKKLEAAEEMNKTLSRTVHELKIEVNDSLQTRENLENKVSQLSENNSVQAKEIGGLYIVNENLVSEIGLLRQEMEENVVTQQNLNMELQEMNNESELWENEASSFCFDLQVSSIHEVLLKNKVQELTGVCMQLENERAAKTLEIEEMRGKFCLMENEISGLKSKVNKYASVVDTLQDDITLLEHNALLQLKPAHNQETEFLEIAADSQTPVEDHSLLSLQNLQARVKLVGKMMEEMNKPMLEKTSTKEDQKSTSEIDDQLKPHRSFGRDKLQRIKTKASNGVVLMKDIPLDQASDSLLRAPQSDDQMLELWETAEDTNKVQTIGDSFRVSCKMTEKDIVYDQFENVRKGKKYEAPLTDSDVEKELEVDRLELSTRKPNHPNREINAGKILDKLAYDSKKLETLQTTVSNLRRKSETGKKGRKGKNIDFEMVDEQLLEAEDNVVHLVDLNEQLVKNIEYCPDDEMASPRMRETVRIWMTKVNDEAEKGADRIDRLQVELQRIQYVLMQMEDERKNKGKNKILMSRTVILGDFVRNGRKNSAKRKKPRCGCFRQSASRSGNSL